MCLDSFLVFVECDSHITRLEPPSTSERTASDLRQPNAASLMRFSIVVSLVHCGSVFTQTCLNSEYRRKRWRGNTIESSLERVAAGGPSEGRLTPCATEDE